MAGIMTSHEMMPPANRMAGDPRADDVADAEIFRSEWPRGRKTGNQWRASGWAVQACTVFIRKV